MTKNTLIRFASLIGLSGLALPGLAEEQRARESRRPPAATSGENGRIDLNAANQKTLEAEPVIGPDLAKAIIAARPFTAVDELSRVKGISAERLEQIRAKVTVAPAHTPAKIGMPAGASGAPTGRADAPKIDINAADLKTLEAVPAIGPELARAIIAARPFATLDELNRIKGISAERLEQIRAALTVAVPETAREKPVIPAP